MNLLHFIFQFFVVSVHLTFISANKNKTDCKCGWINKDLDRIIGGEFAHKNEWPMMVGILTRKEKFQVCGGTIISKHHVLTAGHCVHNNGFKVPVNMLSLVVGVHDLDEVGSSDILPVRKIIVHPKYKWPLTYDVAILLTKEMVFSEFVGPACLPTSKFDAAGKILEHTGWGMTSAYGTNSRILKKTKLQGVSLATCNRAFGNFGIVNMKKQYQMCTYKKGTSQCRGDSGGPILWLNPETNKYTLVGVISFGWYSCDTPAVNTDVSYFAPWIQMILSQTDDTICTGY